MKKKAGRPSGRKSNVGTVTEHFGSAFTLEESEYLYSTWQKSDISQREMILRAVRNWEKLGFPQ